MLDVVFGQMSIEAGRSIWNIEELTTREKTFLCLLADVCHPYLGLPFELHIGMGMKYGLTVEDFREVLRHLGPYAGYTARAMAFERLLEIARQIGVSATRLRPGFMVPSRARSRWLIIRNILS